jgi:hypothetical protein
MVDSAIFARDMGYVITVIVNAMKGGIMVIELNAVAPVKEAVYMAFVSYLIIYLGAYVKKAGKEQTVI